MDIRWFQVYGWALEIDSKYSRRNQKEIIKDPKLYCPI